MNYLGHAFLSFNNADILTGNMIADHVKGKLALDKYPPVYESELPNGKEEILLAAKRYLCVFKRTELN